MINEFGGMSGGGMGIPPNMNNMGGNPNYNDMNRANSYFSSTPEPNLIEWQLEVDSILARIEHMLRGDQLTFNEKTKTKNWMTNTDKSQAIMNDKGIKTVLNFLDFYLNLNTLLSYYGTDEEIHGKMFNLGWDFVDLLYLNYEKFGMDTSEKRKYAPILVRQVVDMVHSAYKRALQGKE